MNVIDVKRAAAGRWPEILSRLGKIDEQILDGKHHPCPLCGGTDRFRLIDRDAGAVLCNQCFRNGNGDGLAAVAWLGRCDFKTSLHRVAEYLGMDDSGQKTRDDLIETVAREKHVRAEALRAFGATIAMRGKLRVVRFPAYNQFGDAHSFFDLAPGSGRGWFKVGKGSSGMFFPRDAAGNVHLPQRGETWHLVEGVKDAAALVDFGYLAAGLPTSAIPVKYVRLFQRADLVVIPDRDRAGEDGADKTCSRLHRVATSVRRATLPAEFRESKGPDVRDVLALANGEAMLRQAIDDAQPWTPREPKLIVANYDLPTIDATERELKIITPLAWDALIRSNQPERLFRRGGIPMRIETDDDGGPVLRPLTKDRVRHELARAANWRVETEDDVKFVQPPSVVVDDILATPDPLLPILQRITEAPVFAPDGTLQTASGYRAAGRTYLMGAIKIPAVPTKPTNVDVAKARHLIVSDLLGEFPFVGDADRAHAVALALLPYARDLIPGPTPLHLFEAPEPGTGKGLAVEVLLGPSVGGYVSMMAEARNDEEWRKRITAKLREGRAALLIDNVRHPLDSGILSAALTLLTWEDRLLGTNEIIRVPNRCAWVATANNPVMSTELARRCIRVRLDAKCDQPWRRTEFKHRNLRQWAGEHRAELVWAALVLIQAWIAEGRPRHEKRLGSFETWAETIGGILDVAEISGFLGNLDQFYAAADREGAVLRAFVQRWWERFADKPVGTKELFPIAQEMDDFDLGKGQEKSQRTVFGRMLGRQRDRVIGGFRVIEAGTEHKATLWRLQKGNVGNNGERCAAPPCTRFDSGHNPLHDPETSPNVPHVPLDTYEADEREAIMEFDGKRQSTFRAGERTPLDE